MKESAKNISNLLIVFAAALFAICLTGCQKELTGKEAVEEYESIEAVEVFKDKAFSDLVEMIDIVDEITEAKSSETRLELYENLQKKQAEIDRACDDLTDLKDYPKTCEELHAQLVKAAENIKNAAECFESAGFYDMQENTNSGTSQAKKASEYTHSAADAAEKYDDLKEEMMK